MLSARPDAANLNGKMHHILHRNKSLPGGFINDQVTIVWGVHQHKQSSHTKYMDISKDTATAQKLQHSCVVSSIG